LLRADRLARQAVLADELGRLLRRLRDLDAGEALDQTRHALGVAAAGDPLEQATVLVRDCERRVAGRNRLRRVGQTQQVTVRDALALAVLDRLVGELVRRLLGVPAADSATERAAPAAEALDEGR